MAGKKKGGGRAAGMSKSLVTGVWLVIIAGAILGWARSNDINDPVGFYDYAKSWSDQVREDCGLENATWDCKGGSPQGPGSNAGNSGPGTTPALPPKAINDLQAKLNGIPVKPAAKNAPYDRGDWQHWSALNGQKCDARQQILLKQGKNVKTASGDSCKVTAGVWTDPYSGTKITNPSFVDIDHVIPLSYASKNGGSGWPAAKKESFANDTTQLIASSRKENRGKGDKGPAAYMPPVKSYHCQYSQTWVRTATKYGLSLPSEDKAVLQKALKTC